MFLEGDASKASIYTETRLQTLLAHREEKMTAYLADLDPGDLETLDAAPEDQELAEKLQALQARQQTYQGLLEELQASDETQISCTDARRPLAQ